MNMEKTPHWNDDELVLLFYRESLDETGKDEAHLVSCAECMDRFKTLAGILGAVTQDEIPEAPADFETRMMMRVLTAAKGDSKPVASEPKGKLLRFPNVIRYVVAVGAMAACLTLAFNVGRNQGHVEEKTLSAAQAKERMLLTALSDHLEKSRVTLVELKNREVSDADLATLQAAADNLVNASRLFRIAAEKAGESQVAGVMEETERMLLPFASAEAKEAKGELTNLRKRVESRDLLFRLRVMEAQVEKRERNITPSPGRSL